MLMQLTDFFNSLPLRGVLAFFAALFLSLACGEKLIGFLHHHQAKGQPIREDGPQSHLLTKKGTPTMGGLLILGSAIVSMLLFADLHNSFVWISILVLLVYGLTGFADDYVKVTKQTANAMTAKMKLFLQFTTALAAVWVITQSAPETGRFELSFPWFRSLALNLGWFYVPFAMIVIAGASNAVNLSDGLDGFRPADCLFSGFCSHRLCLRHGNVCRRRLDAGCAFGRNCRCLRRGCRRLRRFSVV